LPLLRSSAFHIRSLFKVSKRFTGTWIKKESSWF